MTSLAPITLNRIILLFTASTTLLSTPLSYPNECRLPFTSEPEKKAVLDILEQNTFGSPSGKSVNRGAEIYEFHYGGRFSDRMARSTAQDHFLGLGAGNAIFERQLVGVFPNPDYVSFMTNSTDRQIPFVTAVSYKTDEFIDSSGRFRMMTGRLFENIPRSDILRDRPPVTVFFDFWGVMAYTSRPDLALRKIVEVGSENFEFYLIVHTGKSSMYYSTVETDRGSTITLPDWIRQRVQGLRTIEVSESAFLIQPDGRQIMIPTLQWISSDNSRMPPARRFAELRN